MALAVMSTSTAEADQGFPVWVPGRRRFLPDHPFFSAGNVERELLAKQISLNITEEEKSYIGRVEDEQCWTINCPIVGCGAKLSGLSELESHYLVRHSATCSVCGHVFPTKRLLSLHISETHDSFFQAKVARNYPMYECLVEGCSGSFHSDKARHQHLVDKHKFPRAFQFHRKKHRSQKQRQRLHTTQHLSAANPRSDKLDSESQDLGNKSNSSSAMEVEVDQLASGLSRLSTVESKVPGAITFGRKHNRGLSRGPKPKQQRQQQRN